MFEILFDECVMTVFLAKTFSVETRELMYQLRQNYFLEEVLRPVFIWGCGLGTVLLVLALFWKDARVKTAALVALAVAGLLVVPYLDVRREAAEGATPQGVPSPRLTALRKETRWVYFTLSGLAVATLIWGARARLGPALNASVMVGGVAATLTGLWLEAYEHGAMHFTRRTPSPTARPTVTETVADRQRPPYREPLPERARPAETARRANTSAVATAPKPAPTPAPPPVLKTSTPRPERTPIPKAIPVE